MSENTNPFDGEFDKKAAFKEVQRQMLRGGLFAAGVFFGPILFIYAIYLLGTLLPPESKEAADPTPDSFSSYYEQVIDQRLV